MTTPQTIMPLEDWQLDSLENWLRGAAKEDALGCVLVCKDEVLSLIAMARSALHHLEAGKRECQCAEMKRHKEDGYVNEGLIGDPSRRCVYFMDMFDDTPIPPPITFCPWCGGSLSTTPTVEVQP